MSADETLRHLMGESFGAMIRKHPQMLRDAAQQLSYSRRNSCTLKDLHDWEQLHEWQRVEYENEALAMTEGESLDGAGA